MLKISQRGKQKRNINLSLKTDQKITAKFCDTLESTKSKVDSWIKLHMEEHVGHSMKITLARVTVWVKKTSIILLLMIIRPQQLIVL